MLDTILGGGGSGIPSSEDDEGEEADAGLGEYCGDDIDRLFSRGGAGAMAGHMVVVVT